MVGNARVLELDYSSWWLVRCLVCGTDYRASSNVLRKAEVRRGTLHCPQCHGPGQRGQLRKNGTTAVALPFDVLDLLNALSQRRRVARESLLRRALVLLEQELAR